MTNAAISLNTIRVAKPCLASWNAMAGDDYARFCGQCSQHVYNLSEMTESEAHALIQELEGELCVRFYRRADGTMMTKDCPTGIGKRNPHKLSLAILGLFVVFLFLALGIFALSEPPADGERRLTIERAWDWLFPAQAPTCVMGKM